VRIAALDVGSNSLHLLVADVRPDGGLEPVLAEKEMLRLGSRVAETGAVGDEGTRAAIATVARFKALADSLGAQRFVAYATAALRDAKDARRVMERIAAETGVRVRVISGDEEARLIFEAVRASVVIDPAPALAMDIGGGSLELMIGDQKRLRASASLPLGVARLTAELVRGDPPTGGDRRRVVRRVEDEVAAFLPVLTREAPAFAIGSSGTMLTLLRLAASAQDVIPERVNQMSVSIEDLRGVERRLLDQTVAERAALPGVDPRRADLLPAGIVTCVTVMEIAGVDRLTGCEWALREGMILTATPDEGARPRGGPTDLRRRSVADLCHRYRFPAEHSEKVARLAMELFDGTEALHGLGHDDRELLEFGALLHDVGEHVSTESHERHSAYLIEHGRLRGFSPEEVAVLACLARFHRRGGPKSTYPPWAALSPERQERTQRMVALLQVADGLDRGHGGPVRGVDVVVEPGRAARGEGAPRPVVRLKLHADGDIDLERYSVRRKGELFERVFGCRLEVRAAVDAADFLAG
jgi:exopolyphosphatase / guanosine-5'-triphosphate,3'-diphosphate pyrophosphatase